MTTVLDRLEELRAGRKVDARCPNCTSEQQWWLPENSEALGIQLGNYGLGIKCYRMACGFVLNLNPGPPTILCAVCGEALHRSGDNDTAFLCQGCGRRVTA